ncbi:hypothetical protein BVY03_05345, partial [bacterium K02(2017)]
SHPFPGAFTYYQGKKLHVWKVSVPQNPETFIGRIPGKIVRRNKTTKSVQVLTKDSLLELHELGFENTESKPAYDIIKSVRVKLGLSKTMLLNEIETLKKNIQELKSKL